MDKQIKSWTDWSDFNLETAEAMLSGRRYLDGLVSFAIKPLRKFFKLIFQNILPVY